jgi:multisubunit Na+/H+ antiporter MnhB subunit
MRFLRIFIPILVTAILTVLCIFVARWLTGLVPAGEWSDLIKAAIVIFVVASALVTLAWSAYFTYIVRNMINR